MDMPEVGGSTALHSLPEKPGNAGNLIRDRAMPGSNLQGSSIINNNSEARSPGMSVDLGLIKETGTPDSSSLQGY